MMAAAQHELRFRVFSSSAGGRDLTDEFRALHQWATARRVDYAQNVHVHAVPFHHVRLCIHKLFVDDADPVAQAAISAFPTEDRWYHMQNALLRAAMSIIQVATKGHVGMKRVHRDILEYMRGERDVRFEMRMGPAGSLCACAVVAETVLVAMEIARADGANVVFPFRRGPHVTDDLFAAAMRFAADGRMEGTL